MREAARTVLPASETLTAHLDQLAHGLPPQYVEEAAAQAAEAGAHSALQAGPKRRAAPGCCVECHCRTPYVFELRGCRLCVGCERAYPRTYGVVDATIAGTMCALPGSALRGLRSMGRGPERLFLRSDVEAYAARHHAGDEVAAHQRAAAAEWKANSFKSAGVGKSHKWKASIQGPTFQQQQSLGKQQSVATCVARSGLVHVGFGDAPAGAAAHSPVGRGSGAALAGTEGSGSDHGEKGTDDGFW